LADSAATQRDLVAHMGAPPSKVQVLYSGVSGRFCPEAEPGERERLRARYGVGARPYVLSVGTVQPRKNYARLIEAFVRSGLGVAQDGVDLVIAGGRGWLYHDVLEAADRHSESVRILGFVEDADLPALYRQAATFAFPSLYEGFGLPVLEAMACGVPVVCSNVSSLPEVAGAAAMQVDPLDVDGLAAALARLNEDAELRQDLAARGREQAAKFTWQSAARQLLNAFTALAAR
ncbi:MAG: glycosyltransferase family 4 protein, partial [Anaerolineales bacterium]|nr:glycosyltransferase family 4 protein [Anaerolineales bacterium]